MLRVENICKSYGALQALDGVSLDITAGERHAIIGPNGAGKTTLFNIIAGEIAPDQGTISLDGEPITALRTPRRAQLGIGRSYQQNTLFDALTARQNLMLADLARRGRAWRLWRTTAQRRAANERVAEIAIAIGITDWLDTPVRALPYGVKRQLEIGVARTGVTRILLLDEPTAGMAPEETRHMRHLVATVSAELAVLVIEHDMDMVFGIADRLTVLSAGRVIFSGTPADARTSPAVQDAYLGGLNP